jgi:D-hexose-6-phosphate mutarotase
MASYSSSQGFQVGILEMLYLDHFMGGCICCQVQVGNDILEQTLTATNTGSEAFELTAALHTYFGISSIDKVLN